MKGDNLYETMGLVRIAEMSAEKGAVLEYEARGEQCHSGGVVQGGFVTGWIDAAMAHAVIHDTDHAQTVFSLEIKVSFYEKVGPGEGRVEARLIRRGKRVAFLEASLFNPEGQLAAQASSTGMLADLGAEDAGALRRAAAARSSA